MVQFSVSAEWLSAILIMAIGFFPMLAVTATVYAWRWNKRRKKKRSPFTQKLLRLPGESLRTKIEIVSENILTTFFIMFAVPLTALSTILLTFYFNNKPIKPFQLIAISVLSGIIMILALKKLVKLLSERHTLLLGLDGELFVGEELGKLTHMGCWVFHDVMMDKGNIDHVIVGPSGIYTVETKYRSKPTSGNAKIDALVIYDGQALQFPENKIETWPIEQAALQAKWLSKWLSSATGKSIEVRPIVALPGWNVERRVQFCDVFVINPKDPHFLARPNNGYVLSEDQINSIIHQLDQRCRDVEISN